MIQQPYAKVKTYYFVTFQDYCSSHIRKFIRSKILLLLSNTTWERYKNRKTDPKNDANNILVQGFSPKIISLIIANGTDFKRQIPDSSAVYYLCNNFFQLTDAISDEDFTKSQKDELSRLFSQNADQYLNLTYDEIHVLHFHISINRLFRSQWNTNGDINSAIRNWKIFLQFKKIVITKTLAEPILNRIFNISETDFLKAAICIFTILLEKNNSDICRSIIKIGNLNLDNELQQQLCITKDTIQLCLQRLIGTQEQYKLWFEQIQKIHPYYAKHSIPPLFKSPVLQVKSETQICSFNFDNDSYLIPSPTIFLKGLSKAFYLLSKDNPQIFLDNLRQETKSFDIDVEYGEAIEEYYLSFISKNIKSASYERLERTSTKSADFVVSTDKYDFFIEIKKTMASLERSNVLTPTDVFAFWERLTSSCLQVGNSIRKSSTKKIKIGLVCYEECFGMDTGAFIGINIKNSNLKKMGIDYLEFFSFEMLELFIFDPDKNKVGDLIIANHNNYIGSKYNNNNLIPYNLSNFNQANYDEHYEKLYLGLFNR